MDGTLVDMTALESQVLTVSGPPEQVLQFESSGRSRVGMWSWPNQPEPKFSFIPEGQGWMQGGPSWFAGPDPEPYPEPDPVAPSTSVARSWLSSASWFWSRRHSTGVSWAGEDCSKYFPTLTFTLLTFGHPGGIPGTFETIAAMYRAGEMVFRDLIPGGVSHSRVS
jgi:hypothetical protein